VYLTGWFRNAPGPSGVTTRLIPFGTNIVSGSSVTGHDQFVAKLDADGHEVFIRQTGGPQFYTEDNAVAYCLSVDTKGIVTTAGYSRVPKIGGTLDLGAVQMVWPTLSASGTDYQSYYIARLEAGVTPQGPVNLIFARPAPGATTIELAWPAGFHLQRRTNLATGAWETLSVTSPFSASLTEFVQGYYRVTSSP
jgi:hypothetical protein